MYRLEIHEAPAATIRLSSVRPGEYFIVKGNHGKDVVHLRLPYLGVEEPEHVGSLCFDGEGRSLVFFNETIDVIMVTSKVILYKQALE